MEVLAFDEWSQIWSLGNFIPSAVLTFAWPRFCSHWKGLSGLLEEPEICISVCYWKEDFSQSFSFWSEWAKPTLQIPSVSEWVFCVLTVRIDFLRKCKQAGLLDDIFEEMLDTLHLAQEKLMDDNTSETGMETHAGSAFRCQALGPGSPSWGYSFSAE